ncbi:fatty acid desaturase [Bacillus sp. AGMB 02131]|uniref:Fatty acid desaturase n=1 Tax=Peribacillus faecalis TaxID=2772559 RepID=A0A927HCK6_9BACI|nr:fatty acid desaturase [Peribacillus faecalis]MBD3110139.1 fatty acid desaturase [Peribacillus faecalis]
MSKIKQKQNLLRKQVVPYEKAEMKKSVRQLVNTFIPFFALWIAAYASLSVSYLLTLFFGILTAGFVVRMFIIFHDCCHNSFFKSHRANVIFGNITGIVTGFPFMQWRHEHNVHHASSGNLDKRGVGDIWVMTVDEYMAATPKERLAYRLYRNPLVMFGLGPLYLMLWTNRTNRKGARKKERMNTYYTNAAIVSIIAVLCYTIGWKAFLLVHGPIVFIAAMLGIWLFYVQHTFEDSYFEESDEWEYVKAAVEGSSYYQLPKVLQWVTGNIGYHHVHHLSPRVPNYKLEEAHENVAPLQNVPTVTLKTSLESLKFRLWDEEEKKFVTYRDIKRILQKQAV